MWRYTDQTAFQSKISRMHARLNNVQKNKGTFCYK